MAHLSDRSRRGARDGIVEYFSQLAPTYGDGQYYTRRRAAVLRALEPELAAARRLLDLGCGNGRYLEEFARRPTLTLVAGADLSDQMLAEARHRAGARALLVRASAEAIPFRDSAFDLIFASHVLPFVTEVGAAVRDIARRLRGGGCLIATVGRGPVRDYVREVIPESDWEAFSRAAFPRFGNRGARGDALAEHRAAFAAARLEVEARGAEFTVEWDGIVEWIRLRWLVYSTPTERARAEEILAAVPADLHRRSFPITEDLLIGRMPC